jgi:hypothetical protein
MDRNDWSHPLLGYATVAEAAAKLGVTTAQVYHHVHGTGGCRKWPEWRVLGSYGYVIPAVDLNRYWQERMSEKRIISVQVPVGCFQEVQEVIRRYKKGGDDGSCAR